MKVLQIFSLAICSFFIGCGDSQSSDSESSSTENSFIPESLPKNTVISFNPTLRLNGEISDGATVSATYENSDPSSALPTGEGEVSISLVRTSTSLQLQFEHQGKSLLWEITGFEDMGDDGYYDEFSLSAKVDGEKVGDFVGRFSGNDKPRNNAVSNPQKTFQGTPTNKEFRELLTEKVFFTNNDAGNDGSIVLFSKDGGFSSWGDDDKATYIYNYNNGKPLLTLNGVESDGDTWESLIELTFTNFYEGRYKHLDYKENGKFVDDLDSGTFVYYSDISTALKAR